MAALLHGVACVRPRAACARRGASAAQPACCAAACVVPRATASLCLAPAPLRRRSRAPRAAYAAAAPPDAPPLPAVSTSFWRWRGYDIRYTQAGGAGPAVVLVHGFGGNADHWRKNTAVLAAAGMRVFAIDLLGYGYSSKPTPDPERPSTLYNFETWGEQLLDFSAEVVGGPAFLATNSVGGIAALAAAASAASAPGAGGDATSRVRGVVLLDVSLRELHLSKQPALIRPLVAALQSTLRKTSLGQAFFGQVAQANAVRSVLREAYGDPATVTDELVDCILKPGLQPGAAAVFLDFISYSSGPLAEELLPRAGCPVLVGWGTADPWERIERARPLYANAPNVERFVELPGVGHCPQDEAPQLINPLIIDFVRRHAPGE